jgi:hypothetical protein
LSKKTGGNCPGYPKSKVPISETETLPVLKTKFLDIIAGIPGFNLTVSLLVQKKILE